MNALTENSALDNGIVWGSLHPAWSGLAGKAISLEPESRDDGALPRLAELSTCNRRVDISEAAFGPCWLMVCGFCSPLNPLAGNQSENVQTISRGYPPGSSRPSHRHLGRQRKRSSFLNGENRNGRMPYLAEIFSLEK